MTFRPFGFTPEHLHALAARTWAHQTPPPPSTPKEPTVSTKANTLPITPHVAAEARRLGVDPVAVSGSGAGGRVTLADVRNARPPAAAPRRATRPAAAQQPALQQDDGWFPHIVASERAAVFMQALRESNPGARVVLPASYEGDMAHPLLQGPLTTTELPKGQVVLIEQTTLDQLRAAAKRGAVPDDAWFPGV